MTCPQCREVHARISEAIGGTREGETLDQAVSRVLAERDRYVILSWLVCAIPLTLALLLALYA